jgi:cytoskeletal protein CcmA (bactofilin family)
MLKGEAMFRILVAFLLLGHTTFTVQAQDNRPADLVTIDLGTDHFAAGQEINVIKAVAGDLLAAGREVTLGEKVGGDAAAAGGQVFINGNITRNARLAGGNVEIAPSSRIEGGVSIAAAQARVNGSIGGYLQSAGGSLYIDGPIGGDVEAAGGQIELGPNARINGRLRYRSRSALKQDAGAQVLGGIEQLPISVSVPMVARGVGRVVFWIWTLGLMLLVAILIFVLPGFGHVIGMAERRPGASALLGFAMLICIPIGSLILMVTLIGAPLGLLSMAAYFALLLVGYVAAAAAVGDWLLRRLRHGSLEQLGWRIGAAICGIFAIGILGRIPILDGLIVFAALIIGIGAVGLQMTGVLRPAAR